MQGSRIKIHSKNVVRQRCAEGFNSGVKGLMRNKRGVLNGVCETTAVSNELS
jgi:hypothetical protein